METSGPHVPQEPHRLAWIALGAFSPSKISEPVLGVAPAVEAGHATHKIPGIGQNLKGLKIWIRMNAAQLPNLPFHVGCRVIFAPCRGFGTASRLLRQMPRIAATSGIIITHISYLS